MEAYFVEIDFGIGYKKTKYTKEQHGGLYCKFVFWKEIDLLVVSLGANMHSKIVEMARGCYLTRTVEVPDGAGHFFKGTIQSWESLGYEIETPENLRIAISETLGIIASTV